MRVSCNWNRCCSVLLGDKNPKREPKTLETLAELYNENAKFSIFVCLMYVLDIHIQPAHRDRDGPSCFLIRMDQVV